VFSDTVLGNDKPAWESFMNLDVLRTKLLGYETILNRISSASTNVEDRVEREIYETLAAETRVKIAELEAVISE
jgi:hypothetical protein